MEIETNEKMNNVLFISNVPSPYNISYLDELGKILHVTAVFEMSTSIERDSSWKSYKVNSFDCVILNGKKVDVDKAISFQVIKYIRKMKNATIIIGNPATPTGIIAILYCKSHRIPYVLQSEGGIPKDGKGFKEKFKFFLMHSATYYLSGMGKDNDYFLTYGAKKEKIYQYPFTSLYKADLVKKILTTEEKKNARKRMGIQAERMILFVGQFIHRKGIDILLKACKNLSEDVYVLIIGGKPTKEYQEIIREYGLKNIHFMEFILKDELLKYYEAADFFVLPTREDTWGLVVNEAMAKGLPVITTKNCVAGLELIKDDENGYLVESEDIGDLEEKMKYLILNPGLCLEMGNRNFQKIQEYTFENMAKVIADVIRTRKE